MNPDLLLHHQGSLTSLKAIARTDGAAGAAAPPLLHGLAIQGPPQDAQAQGRDKRGSLEPKRAVKGWFVFFFLLLLLALELLHNMLDWCSAPSILPQPLRSPWHGQAAGRVEMPAGWQRAARPKWADEMGMKIHAKLQGSKMDWREH